jgi:PhnB protein
VRVATRTIVNLTALPGETAMQVQPYLFFNGRCEEAIEFYQRALGAKVEMIQRFKDAPDHAQMPPGMADKVMHASIRVGDSAVMASDGRGEGTTKFEGFSLSLTVADEAQAQHTFNALAEGGAIQMPLQKTFWTPAFGMVSDKFGIVWMVNVMH